MPHALELHEFAIQTQRWFKTEVAKAGLHPEDLRVDMIPLDPLVVPGSDRLMITVTCTASAASRSYEAHAPFDWVTDFASDLATGAFNAV